MKIQPQCHKCIYKQLINLMKLIPEDYVNKDQLYEKELAFLNNYNFDCTTPEAIADLYYDLLNKLEIKDLFKEEKKSHNKIALQLVEKMKLKNVIETNDDPLMTALKLSIAGNIIDFSVGYEINEDVISDSINRSLTEEINGLTSKQLISAVNKAQKILFLTDNAGEIVFDKLLIDLLPKEKITYVVKGMPAINDATIDDAKMVNMDNLVKVVDNGAKTQGTVLNCCSKEFKNLYNEADLIISKGQANYETLEQENKKIIFLLQAKCEIIANHLNVPLKSFVAKTNNI